MMSDLVKVALISSVPGVLGSVAALILAIRHRRVERVVIDLKTSLNGRLDQWIRATEKSSFAEGKLEGKSGK